MKDLINNPIIIEILKYFTAPVLALIINAFVNGLPPQMRTATRYLSGKTWETTWFIGDDEVYVRDVVYFAKRFWFGKITGHGIMTSPDEKGTNREYKYPITLQVYPGNNLTFKYFAQRFPAEGLMGTGCGKLNIDARKIDGGWSGTVNQEKYKKSVIYGRFVMELKS